jgi:hypothetical protein
MSHALYSNRTYYFNRVTNETTWEKPDGFEDGAADETAAADTDAAESAAAAEAESTAEAAETAKTSVSEDRFKALREDSAKNNAKGKRTSVLEKKMAEAKQKKVTDGYA